MLAILIDEGVLDANRTTTTHDQPTAFDKSTSTEAHEQNKEESIDIDSSELTKSRPQGSLSATMASRTQGQTARSYLRHLPIVLLFAAALLVPLFTMIVAALSEDVPFGFDALDHKVLQYRHGNGSESTAGNGNSELLARVPALTTYGKAKRKGQKLLCALRDPELVGALARSPWKGVEQLGEWGWVGEEEDGKDYSHVTGAVRNP